MTTLTELHTLLNYRHPHVLNRYERDYPLSNLSATQAWTEFLKFVWLARKHQQEKIFYPDDVALQFHCSIYTEMRDIDNIWHTFLLFTQDYNEFCQRYLNGEFFHHQPLELAADKENNVTQLERYLSYIYDNLGAETLALWFQS